MKKIFFLFVLTLLFSCQKEAAKKPSFLIGNWKRTNDKAGNQTFETWNKDFTGKGYTKKGGKTTFEETLSIVNINDTLHLKVVGVNPTPTLFKFTNQTDTSFVCENPKNDFPKKITYYKDGKQLKAIVANSNFKIDFIFEEVKKGQ